MFGPNTHITSKLSLNYSHRDAEFFNLYREVDALLKSTFDLDDYHILFIPGSGTVGNLDSGRFGVQLAEQGAQSNLDRAALLATVKTVEHRM